MLNQIDEIDRQGNKSRPYETDFTPMLKGYTRQLSLFEPNTLYISNNAEILIGSCRTGIVEWIRRTNHYAYPISDEEVVNYPKIFKVKSVLIMHKKKIVGFYTVKEIRIVDKSDLKLLDYPTRSSRHKADTKYLLFDLDFTTDIPSDFRIDNYNAILGKGCSDI